ncbi:hypothetical protein BKA70DRAFT_1220655 [Coprinopsis sp. MPI-PUGE-AT-0042]|nr:hypothetical protein BKA70DRAFT_1220655 [Coprinopsis sp. MPI-PUGE-AT-0042]
MTDQLGLNAVPQDITGERIISEDRDDEDISPDDKADGSGEGGGDESDEEGDEEDSAKVNFGDNPDGGEDPIELRQEASASKTKNSCCSTLTFRSVETEIAKAALSYTLVIEPSGLQVNQPGSS